jgi:hypothetical protein
MTRSIRRSLLLLVLCVPAPLAAPTHAPDFGQDPEVWRAAGTWLALLDARSYAETWRESARVFQSRLTAEAWAREAATMREHGGDPVSRELIDSHEVTDPPAVAPGTYIRLRFEHQCVRAGVVRETVLMVNDAGRGWRVASYTVAPVG